ncbi:MAG: orotidine 5'-phosphate decarboxylase / HUMPS family protein [Candidatus Eisenbacteria bacterium]
MNSTTGRPPGGRPARPKSAAERLIVALDFPTRTEALALVDQLGDAVRWYKVGMELFYAEGAPFIESCAVGTSRSSSTSSPRHSEHDGAGGAELGAPRGGAHHRACVGGREALLAVAGGGARRWGRGRRGFSE